MDVLSPDLSCGSLKRMEPLAANELSGIAWHTTTTHVFHFLSSRPQATFYGA